MKHLLLVSTLALGTAIANEPPPADPAPGHQPAQGSAKFKDRMRDKMLENLTPENRARFEKAREQALQDPKISALREQAEKSNREFFDAMRQKMNEIDPGLEAIVKEGMGKQKNDKPGNGEKGGRGPDRGLANLNEGERQRLMAARESSKNDPAVVAAQEKRNKATTQEERMQAGMEFAKAMREAILKADPSMAAVLEKIQPPKHHKQGPPSGPDGMMPPGGN
jgi:hypothetical protein